MKQTMLINGLADVVQQYDALLVDLWGCLHNGVEPYPEAVNALSKAKEAGLGVCLLSNGPRRVSALIDRLNEMGVPPEIYDAAMSSGEATWRAIAEPADDWHRRLGRRCYHLGPERDSSVHRDSGVTTVDDIADADFVLCTGIYEWDETVEDHAPLLAAAARRGLPLVCANPDLIVHVGEKLSICAGTLAEHYAAIGGDVAFHGKPWPGVYEACRELLGGVAFERVLGIGDSLRTDVTGANRIGAGSLFLTEGIHQGEFGMPPVPDRVAASDAGPAPDWIIPRLRW